MLMVFPLLAVFMIAGSKLFLLNNTALQQASANHLRLSTTDAAVHRLRLDCLTAGDADVADDGKLTLAIPGVGDVTWQTDNADDLMRIVENPAQAIVLKREYAELGDARFERVSGGVVFMLDGERYPCPLGGATAQALSNGEQP
ncbi:hypothetical protein OT109_01520 [Phycisphaeraceae bacterium D3-23]